MQYDDYHIDLWWLGCYFLYSEEVHGGGHPTQSISLLYPMLQPTHQGPLYQIHITIWAGND